MAQGKSNNNIIYYTTTLQNAAAATGNGTAVNCKGIGSLGIQINGTFSGTVVFEATVDDSNWIAIEGTNLNTSAKATSATAAGIFRFDTSQLSQFRARISVYSSGSITVKGISSELPMGGAPEASTVASVQGQAADDAAKSGNPVQVGGIYSTTPATRANGDMVAWEMSATGAGSVQLTGSAPADAKTVGAGDVNAIVSLYNNSNYDRTRNNIEGTLLASAARTVSTASPDQTNYNSRGVLVTLYVTVASGTGGLTLNVNSRTGGVAYNLNAAPTAITATGVYVYEVYPGASTAGTAGTEKVNQRTAGSLPRTWYVAVTHGDASSYTYQVEYALIN